MNRRLTNGRTLARRGLQVSLILAFSSVVVLRPAPAQEVTGDWVRYTGNPVLTLRAQGRALAADPVILVESDRSSNPYRIWFGHEDPHRSRGASARVGYADSPNGMDGWINTRLAIVPLGPPGAWDDANVETPHVVVDPREPVGSPSRYKLWYAGYTEVLRFDEEGRPEIDRKTGQQAVSQEYRIGYATSPNGVDGWQRLPADRSPYRQEGLVLDLLFGDRWYETALADPSVLLREDGTYHMWYSLGMVRLDRGVGDGGIGYATSRDGIHWTRQNGGNPVMRASGWDAQLVGEHALGSPAQPYVMWNGRFYEMWYNAGQYDNEFAVQDPPRQLAIGYAVSDDGMNWLKLDHAILVPDPSTEPSSAGPPPVPYGWFPGVAVVHRDSETLLYYPVITEVGPAVTRQDGSRRNPVLRVDLYLATRRHSTPPAAATLRLPSDTTPRPRFEWNRVPGAAWYQLRVQDTSGNRIAGEWYTADQAGCSSERETTCRARLSAALAAGSWQWLVQTRNPDGLGPWSPPGTFTVGAPPISVVVTSDLRAPQPAGAEITFTATAAGGVEPRQYKWLTFDGTAWTVVRENPEDPGWRTQNTFVWTPTTPNGAYRVAVWVRSRGQTADTPEGHATVAFPIRPSPMRLVEMVASRRPLQPPGKFITFGAITSGGTGLYESKWWLSTNGGASYTVVRDWAPGITFTWTPTQPNDNYRVGVWLRSAGATGDTFEAGGSIPFRIAGAALSLTGLSANRAAPQPVGAAITFTAGATGGTPPHRFQWFLWDGAAWTLLQNWGAGTFTWTPTEPNPNYRVEVWARSADNGRDAPERPEATSVLSFPITATALTFGGLAPDPGHLSPQPAGTTITFTAMGSGGITPYQSKWWLSTNGGASYTIIRDWAPGTTFTWAPTTANPNYRVGVWLRSAGATADRYEGGGAIPFVITAPLPLAYSGITPSPTSPRPARTSITFTATATGGITPYQSKWWLSTNGGASYTIIRDWAPGTTFTWTPTQPNPNYRIGVWLRSAGATADAYEDGGAIPFVITGGVALSGHCGRYGTLTVTGLIHDQQLDEISGIAASHSYPGVYYVHNDSGTGNWFFVLRIDSANPSREAERREPVPVLGRIDLVVPDIPDPNRPGEVVPDDMEDPEDIAIMRGADGTYSVVLLDGGSDPPLYRDVIKVYRVPEPQVDLATGRIVSPMPFRAEVFRGRYPDGAYDAEAMFVDRETGRIYVVARRLEADFGSARVYRFPETLRPGPPMPLEFVTTLPDAPGEEGRLQYPSGAATAPDNLRVVIRNDHKAHEFRRDSREEPFEAMLRRPPAEIPLYYWIGDTLYMENQGEAITYTSDGRQLITTGELGKEGTFPVPVHKVTCLDP